MSVVWDRSEMVFLRHFRKPYSDRLLLRQLRPHQQSSGRSPHLQRRHRPHPHGRVRTRSRPRRQHRQERLPLPAARRLSRSSRSGRGHRARPSASSTANATSAPSPSSSSRPFSPCPAPSRRFPRHCSAPRTARSACFALLLVTAAVNLALDWALIRHHGAVGAAIANGCAQAFGILALWWQTRRLYTFHFPFEQAFRLFAAGLLMASRRVRDRPRVADPARPHRSRPDRGSGVLCTRQTLSRPRLQRSRSARADWEPSARFSAHRLPGDHRLRHTLPHDPQSRQACYFACLAAPESGPTCNPDSSTTSKSVARMARSSCR